MKRVALGAIALLLLAGVMLVGCQKKETAEVRTVVVASDATWPPMEFVNADKQIVGYDIDLIQAIGDAAGFKVVIQNTAWDGIFASLAAGEADAVISSVTITDERKQTMDFSDPYINAGQVLIVPLTTTGVTTLADLSGKKVGAQIGTTGAFEVEKVSGVELVTYDELGLAIEDLANGRLAGVVADTPIAADYVLQNDKYSGKLQIVGKPFTDEYYGIAVNKGDTELLKLINDGLAKVKADGLLTQLEDKWLR